MPSRVPAAMRHNTRSSSLAGIELPGRPISRLTPNTARSGYTRTTTLSHLRPTEIRPSETATTDGIVAYRPSGIATGAFSVTTATHDLVVPKSMRTPLPTLG